MCPGNHEHAGRRLRAVLVEAAHAAGRTKQRAAVAVGHAMLGIAYHLLTAGTIYQDLGAHYFDERARQAVDAASSADWTHAATRSLSRPSPPECWGRRLFSPRYSAMGARLTP
jgi:hypothetical protein